MPHVQKCTWKDIVWALYIYIRSHNCTKRNCAIYPSKIALCHILLSLYSFLILHENSFDYLLSTVEAPSNFILYGLSWLQHNECQPSIRAHTADMSILWTPRRLSLGTCKLLITQHQSRASLWKLDWQWLRCVHYGCSIRFGRATSYLIIMYMHVEVFK